MHIKSKLITKTTIDLLPKNQTWWDKKKSACSQNETACDFDKVLESLKPAPYSSSSLIIAALIYIPSQNNIVKL